MRVCYLSQWERNNSLTRDIELGQAYLLILEIGIWSGRSRKVEIAESFFPALLTMHRRDGSFVRSHSRSETSREILTDTHTDDAPREKWKAWVRHETAKRYTFRLLQYDTTTSMALLTNPMISYAEVLLTFPDSAELWSAATPEQWKSCYTAQQSGDDSDRQGNTMATLPAFLENPAAFIATHGGKVDMGIACSAFLSCAWALTWEYVKLSVLQREMSAAASGGTATHTSGITGTTTRRWSALVMGSRQDEILKLIHAFRISTETLACPAATLTPEMVMRTELILMHTHTVLEQVQLFAGMEGQDQARAVHPVIMEWVTSESARKSLWHAGQVLRAARSLLRGVICGSTAVIVYHAGLTLWIYGAASRSLATPLPVSPVPVGDSDDLLMDGPDTGLTLQRFFTRGYGRPCISDGPRDRASHQDGSETVPLCRPDKVMAVISGILCHGHDKISRPHMVQCLIQLIDEIQKVSTMAEDADAPGNMHTVQM